MKLYRYLIEGFLDWQYGKFEDIPENTISYEEVKNKKDLAKLQKNKEDYGYYILEI